jgi:ribosomal protein L11 methyltransferase
VIRLAVRVRAGDAELAYARLESLFAAGVEERAAGGEIEYGLYGPPLPSETEIRALGGDTVLGVEVTPVAGDWETAYHAHLTRITAGEWAIRPPWVAGEASDLVIDPGTAFGAGTHPTTRLCLELLTEVEASGGLADWGSGTGVLAIAAARLGFSPVAAYDLDGVDLIRSNAMANGVSLTASQLDLTVMPAPWAPTVVANLTLPLLAAAAAMQSRPERLIASGVLVREAGAVAPAWGLVERERRELDGWAALVLERT